MANNALTGALRETLALFDNPVAPRTTSEIANELDLGRRSTYDRLERLVDQGRLRTKKVGANARVWWQPPSDDDGTGGDKHPQFHSLVDAVEEYAIFLLDPDGYVRTWNSGAEEIKGYVEEEIVGEHFSTFYPEEDREARVPERNLAQAARDGSVVDEGWRIRADGTQFWANVTITAIYDDEGELEGFAKVTRDMTDRRERERQLRRERDLVERILETVPVGLGIVTAEGELVQTSTRAKVILGGHDAKEGSRIKDRQLYDADGDPVPPEERPSAQVFATGESVHEWQCQIEDPDGGRRWLTVNAAPLKGEDDEVERVVVAGEDITQLKAQARQLGRQRDELESELGEIFERIDDGFFALDKNLCFVHLNDQAVDAFDRAASEFIGEHVWDALEPSLKAEAAFEAALETDESVTFEEYSEPMETWFETHVYPSETGLSVYFRDVTERKHRRQELERYRSVVETMSEGVYIVDDDGYFSLVNDQYASMVARSKDALQGAHVSAVIDDESTLEQARRLEAELIDGERDSATLETELQRPDGEPWIGEATFTVMATDSGHERIGVVRDVTRRRERERRLEQYEQLVETVWDGVYALDENDHFVLVNEAFCDLVGYDREEILGEHPTLINSEAVNETANELESEVLTGDREVGVLEFEVETADGDTVPVESRFGPFEYEDGRVGRCGVVRDVSGRKERKRELKRRIRQQRMVATLGQDALDIENLDGLFSEAAEMIAEALDHEYCKVLDLDGDTDELLLRQGVGWDDGIVGSATVSAVEADSQAAYTLESRDPVIVEDLTTETRFSGPDLLTDHDVKSGISVVIGPSDDPWGILGTHDTTAKEFSDQDVDFVQAVATILATAIERRQHERRLVRNNEELAAHDSLNAVVRDITEAVIEQSTREEIEATVCERLAESESYQFAWIADVDPQTMALDSHVEAGVEGYLEEVPTSMDPDEPSGQGPGGKAIRTREIQTIQNALTDPDFEPWREQAKTYGYRSMAAIPILHNGTLYGLLGLYADRPTAFEGHEKEVIGQLGEIVGHAIASAERKQALMSDELVELDFHMDGILDELDVSMPANERITLDHAVPLGGDEFLVYGTATPGAVETVRDVVDVLDYWESVEFRDDGDPLRFELQMSDPPVLSTVASLGGYVEEAIVADGDFKLRIHLAPTVDVHRVIDVVETAYQTAEMRRRRQITRAAADPQRIQRKLLADLTEKQRAALEAAYHAGFFGWPRDVSGEELADSLGVAPPTFHQHLRKAEAKAFGSLLAAETPS
ncbi:PAS domain S-box-containing protein [Halorientalis persicus]|uniref:PAS domain S-box-containing protein n=1 Tax=Halorientalis persicus TaxID=1367881 RepID=A0A1H8MPB8_9EURY|nr:PAS domain S-box protein [Halorientalis persicus]SEO19108.1 PAS domain S-box-containing protein [Halorientalis persicus]